MTSMSTISNERSRASQIRLFFLIPSANLAIYYPFRSFDPTPPHLRREGERDEGKGEFLPTSNVTIGNGAG